MHPKRPSEGNFKIFTLGVIGRSLNMVNLKDKDIMFIPTVGLYGIHMGVLRIKHESVEGGEFI